MSTKKIHFGALKDQKPFLTVHQTMNAADAHFYSGYDPQFLAKKASILYGIYKNTEAFRQCAASWDVRAETNEEDLLSVIATELHNASFHQTEAMIAFLLCEFQSRPDWVYLTTYGNAEMKTAAKAIAAGEFGSVSKGKCATAEEFVKAAVYATWNFSATEGSDAWERSVQDIGWLIGHVAERFACAHEYNAYKHGVRVVSGAAALGVSASLLSAKILPVMSLKHSVTHLELGETPEGYVGSCVTKEISPEYSFELIQCMAGVLMTAKDMRVARTKRTVDTLPLTEMNRDHLLNLQPHSNFSLPY